MINNITIDGIPRMQKTLKSAILALKKTGGNHLKFIELFVNSPLDFDDIDYTQIEHTAHKENIIIEVFYITKSEEDLHSLIKNNKLSNVKICDVLRFRNGKKIISRLNNYFHQKLYDIEESTNREQSNKLMRFNDNDNYDSERNDDNYEEEEEEEDYFEKDDALNHPNLDENFEKNR